ncbi:hypothetical protein ADK64_36870 [Streptomyces sp. MMG1121]|nr:hypothetical protein ADK64_36870 [Streptomyces sp. MMG1121]
MDQREYHVLEFRPIGDPAAMAAEWVARGELRVGGQESGEWVPEGFEQARWQRGHGCPSGSQNVEDSMIT